MIDFKALTTEQRLGLIECILGLLPSGPDWQSRAVYLAFQIAQENGGHAPDVLPSLERERPGFFENAALFAKEIHGLELPWLEATDAA